MARTSNVVVRTIIDPGNPKSLRDAAQRIGVMTRQLRDFLKDVLPEVRQLLDDNEFKPMLLKLRRYPPRQKGMDMRWKSRKQQRYVMMMLRAMGMEDGYERSGALAAGWYANVTVDPKSGKLIARVGNDAKGRDPFHPGTRYMPFVQGNIGLGTSGQSLERYDQPIQPFHKDRGWQPAQPQIAATFKRADVRAQNQFDLRMDALIKRNGA